MLMVLRVFTIFVLIAPHVSPAELTRQRIARVASKCCVAQKKECCEEMITFGKPIRCGFEARYEWVKHIYNCIQEELYGSEMEKRMNLEDGVCCQVYSNDQKDREMSCESTCKTVMQSPSIESKIRIERIQKCSIVENPLFECFQNCRRLRSQGIHIEVLHFDEYCNSTYLQKPGQPIKIVENPMSDQKI